MRKKINTYIIVGVMSIFGAVSCVDFLERTPETIIDERMAFRNFINFQGFIEEMFHMIPDKAKHNWVSSFNWGDDEVMSSIAGAWSVGVQFDRGNFRHIFANNSFLTRGNPVGWRSNNAHNKDIWGSSWYTIRKSNVGIQAIRDGLLIDATQEEHDMLLGQLYFLRGWAHFNVIKYWGGMPFIDEVLPTDERVNMTRLTYHETATRIGQDFRRAADLLPIDWDRTTPGARTMGHNQLRANKIWALGMLGKNYLFAASPLMTHGPGGPRTYDRAFAQRAADAFGELLYLVESGQTQYELVPFNFDVVFDLQNSHTNPYSQLFFTLRQNWTDPGLNESIIRNSNFGANASRWRQGQSYLPQEMVDGDNIVLSAAANYVNFFGMANGLPLTHPESGFNPDQPWRDRDPRFYAKIIFDGVQAVRGDLPAALAAYWRFANLYTGGSWVDQTRPRATIETGYGIRKIAPMGTNRWDDDNGWGGNLNLMLSWMRLADVYLMYAEAVAQATQSPTGRSSHINLTAVEAVNTVRARVGVAPLHADFTGSLDAFMSELRRERAVELAFEAHRFNDLRRWLLLSQYPYNIKTRQDFDRVLPFDPAADPRYREVRNFRETVIIRRPFDNRHYWLPINDHDINLYEGFHQNPGW